MTCYINKYKSTQPQICGDTLQIQGTPIADYTSGASPQTYTVTDGVNYLSCWSDAAFKVSTTNLADGTSEFEAAYPASTVVEIGDVQIGSVVTVTEL